MAKITYTNKVKIKDIPVAEVNKFTADNANEIKTIVNDLDDIKQDALVSGTNIKTINGTSLLGSGDITISGGGGDTVLLITTEPTVSRTLSDTDECIVFTNANPVTFTIPTNATLPIPIGTKVQYTQQGDGTVTIGGAGITFVTNLTLAMVKGETRTLTKIDTDVWSLAGANTTRRTFSIVFSWTGSYAANASPYTPDRELGHANNPTMTINNPTQGTALPIKCRLKAVVHSGNALASANVTLYVFKRYFGAVATKVLTSTYSGGVSYNFVYGTEIRNDVIFNAGDWVYPGFLNPTTPTGTWRTPSLTLLFEEEF